MRAPRVRPPSTPRTRIAAPKKYHGYLRRLAAKDVGALEPDGDDDAREPDDEGTL